MVAKMAERNSAPYFIGDHLAMDFLNSRIDSTHNGIDWLGDGARFLKWLVQAGAIDAAIARRFRAEEANAFGTLDTIAEQARGLRDWLRDFVGRHAGSEIEADAMDELASLNRLLARDNTYRQIEATGTEADAYMRSHALRRYQVRRWTSPEHLLQPIAEAIGDLICNEDFRLVRTCEGHDCVLVFYDRTKSHARRWCSMALCGNRAKAAAHRARNRQPRVRAN